MTIHRVIHTFRQGEGSFWNRCKLLFPLQRNFALEDYVRIIDGAEGKKLKVISAIVKDKPQPESLFEYLSSISGLSLYLHESEFRYGEGEYNRGSDEHTFIVIVPSIQLYRIPWYMRRWGWKYISITCQLTDERFDLFDKYEAIPTIKYRI